jgi:hypothetical protein
MTVYTLETGGGLDGDHDLHGIFSTREAAEAYPSVAGLTPYQCATATVREWLLDGPELWASPSDALIELRDRAIDDHRAGRTAELRFDAEGNME